MRFLLITALVLSVVACKDNPYPVDINASNVSGEGKPDTVVRRSGLSADLPDSIKLREGVLKEHVFRVAVPEPGLAIVEVKNLPAGASFDPKTFALSWTPGYFDGNSSNDPTIKSRIYTVEFWLRSSIVDNEAISKEISLIVYDVPRSVNIEADDTKKIYEGELEEFYFNISNKDYPEGPFDISIDGFPENAAVVKISDTEYKVTFGIDYDFLKITEKCKTSQFGSDYGCRNYQSLIHATNPAGHKTEKVVELRVHDTRLDGIIESPGELTQGLDLSFQVISYDPNKEINPSVSISHNLPSGIGELKVTSSESTEEHTTVTTVNLSDIPPSYNGKSLDFTIRSCVKNDYNSTSNCSSESVTVNIVVRDKLPPIISRSSWPIGEMKYYSFNQSIDYYMSITDAHSWALKPTVEIFPIEMRKYVSWNGGRLDIQVDKAGIYQFNIRATSEYNIQAAESFLFEVFADSRSPFLLFADSTKDPEVKFYRELYPEINIMNPVIQDINQRNVAGRKTLLLTTSIIQDKAIHPKMIDAIKKIKNIIIASPLIADLPEILLKEIREDYGVTIRGRYNDFSLPALNTGILVTRKDFQASVNDVKLSGLASIESHNPALFSTGVDTRSCKPVMELTDVTRSFREELAIICDRDNGGRMVLLGTEWADFQATADDSNIIKQWMEKTLSTSVNY